MAHAVYHCPVCQHGGLEWSLILVVNGEHNIGGLSGGENFLLNCNLGNVGRGALGAGGCLPRIFCLYAVLMGWVGVNGVLRGDLHQSVE